MLGGKEDFELCVLGRAANARSEVAMVVIRINAHPALRRIEMALGDGFANTCYVCRTAFTDRPCEQMHGNVGCFRVGRRKFGLPESRTVIFDKPVVGRTVDGLEVDRRTYMVNARTGRKGEQVDLRHVATGNLR